MIDNIISAFTDPFASTPFWWNRINAIFWRLRGCNHDGDFYLDIGDEEHSVMYCFRCNRRV